MESVHHSQIEGVVVVGGVNVEDGAQNAAALILKKTGENKITMTHIPGTELGVWLPPGPPKCTCLWRGQGNAPWLPFGWNVLSIETSTQFPLDANKTRFCASF